VDRVSTLIAVDPGQTHSAYVIIGTDDLRPREHGKVVNDDLLAMLGRLDGTPVVIEMIASYGMTVGAEVFETCVWIGRFSEAARATTGRLPQRIPRGPVKRHHCHSSRAKDSNVTQALVDRFAPGQRNFGKGTKADPGWFHGFHRDVWAAYALAVYAADQMRGEGPAGTWQAWQPGGEL
jgi:hypothetical protein